MGGERNMHVIRGKLCTVLKSKCGKIRFFSISVQCSLHSNTYFNMPHYSASKDFLNGRVLVFAGKKDDSQTEWEHNGNSAMPKYL